MIGRQFSEKKENQTFFLDEQTEYKLGCGGQGM